MRVYGYTRVSTQSQADSGLGLEAQRHKLETYAQLHDLTVGYTFTDEGISGKIALDKRPEGGRMVDALEPGDHVIMASLDRGFRSALDVGRTIPEWHARGIGVHIIDLGVDTTTPMGWCITQIMAAIAELEAGLIAERTRSALNERVRQGKAATGRAPWGWVIGEDELLEIHPIEGLAAGEVWELRESGWSWSRCASHLNELGHSTRRGKEWNKNRLESAVQGNQPQSRKEALLDYWHRRRG